MNNTIREMSRHCPNSDRTFCLNDLDDEFKKLLLDPHQQRMLRLRLEFTRSFLSREKQDIKETWACEPGTLTIVHLQEASVDPHRASALFQICLKAFDHYVGEKQKKTIALDDAHKVCQTVICEDSKEATNLH